MNKAKLIGQIRHIIAALGVYTSSTEQGLTITIGGAALAIGMAVWSYFAPEKATAPKA